MMWHPQVKYLDPDAKFPENKEDNAFCVLLWTEIQFTLTYQEGRWNLLSVPEKTLNEVIFMENIRSGKILTETELSNKVQYYMKMETYVAEWVIERTKK
jgi:hypothetical protein